MKIGILAYPHYSLPPKQYGPMQTVASEIAEGLFKRGHEVTTFATGDSKIPGKIIVVKDTPVMEDLTVPDHRIYEYVTINKLLEHKDDFEILSSHISFHILPFIKFLKYPVIVNLQGDYSNPHFRKIFELYKGAYYVSISNRQRDFLPGLNYVATVYHGIKIEDFPFSDHPHNQIAFLGRTSPVKGLDVAIEVAKKANIKLVIGARQDPNPIAEKFYQEKILPQVDGKKVVWLGELGQIEKTKLLQQSKVLVFPINWEEAFGLVMIEAMACGTPVVAFRRGSVPEIIKDGKTGFICSPNDIEAMVRAVKKIYEMPEDEYRLMRRNCRRHVEENFTVEKMVSGYEKVYQKVIIDWKRKNGR